MKPAPFTYHRATSAREAVDMLAAAGEEGSVLAGGQSLVPLMNVRVAKPAHLVDINYVDELDYIRVDDGAVAIGARTRQTTLERSADVARAAPLLREAIGWVAHPPVRHRGTVAGAAISGDAIALFGVADTPLRASDAEQRLAGGGDAGEVAEAATAGLHPNDDVHGGAAYRRRVARACVERAIRRARNGGAR